MPHITNKMEHGPLTFDCGTDTIIGGRLVELKTDGTIKHTTAGTKKFIGVAIDDAMPLAGQAVDGYNVSANIMHSEVAVGYRGVWRLEYAAAAACGDWLVAAADGKVTPYTSGTSTFDQIIGRCVEPGGVLINKRGRTLLTIG